MLAVCGQVSTLVSNREDGLRACPLDHRHLEIWISHEKEVSLSDHRHETGISHEMEVSLSDLRHEIGISHALPLVVADPMYNVGANRGGTNQWCNHEDLDTRKVCNGDKWLCPPQTAAVRGRE